MSEGLFRLCFLIGLGGAAGCASSSRSASPTALEASHHLTSVFRIGGLEEAPGDEAVSRLESSVSKVAGVHSALLDRQTRLLKVRHGEGVHRARIDEAIEEAGFWLEDEVPSALTNGGSDDTESEDEESDAPLTEPALEDPFSNDEPPSADDAEDDDSQDEDEDGLDSEDDDEIRR